MYRNKKYEVGEHDDMTSEGGIVTNGGAYVQNTVALLVDQMCTATAVVELADGTKGTLEAAELALVPFELSKPAVSLPLVTRLDSLEEGTRPLVK